MRNRYAPPPTTAGADDALALILAARSAHRAARTPMALRDAALGFARAARRNVCPPHVARESVAAARAYHAEAMAILWPRGARA